MNPIIQGYFDRFEKELDALEEAIGDSQARIQHEAAQAERFRNQFWSQSKETGILKQTAAEFEALQDENQRLKIAQDDIEERLQRVLGLTKGLVEEFRP